MGLGGVRGHTGITLVMVSLRRWLLLRHGLFAAVTVVVTTRSPPQAGQFQLPAASRNVQFLIKSFTEELNCSIPQRVLPMRA